MNIEKKILTTVLRYAFLIFVVIVSLFPFLWTLMSSLKTDQEIFGSPLALPTVLRFGNYVNVLTKTPIIQFYVNSIIVAVCTTLAAVFVYGLAAYVLARFVFKGRDFIFNALSLSILVPITAIIQPIYIITRNLGIYNTKLGLVVVYTALAMPVTLFIIRSYFKTIPWEMEEAAYIDGSSFFRTYFLVIFPIAKPGFSSAAVLAFLLAWNDFMYAFILTESNSVRTLPIALKYLFDSFSSVYSRFFAAVSLVIFPTIIAYILLQEQIEAGLVAGAVKG